MKLVLTVVLFAAAAMAQSANLSKEWPTYGHDPGAMRYSPLRQINARNVDRLKLAWTFRTGAPGSGKPCSCWQRRPGRADHPGRSGRQIEESGVRRLKRGSGGHSCPLWRTRN